MILIVGAKGNMGRRYSKILEYLGKDWVGVDVENNRHYMLAEAQKSDGIIIATPTDTHLDFIKMFAPLKKQMLCEKPLSRSTQELKETLALVDRNTPLTMVYQYAELASINTRGDSYYNYWNHGKDGLAWDCIQIVGLAKSEIRLGEESPIWKCGINGRSLHIQYMDQAYIKMMNRWFRSPGQDPQYLLDIHYKTAMVAEKLKHDLSE